MATTRHQVDNLGNIVIGEKAKIQNIEGFFEYLWFCGGHKWNNRLSRD